MRPVRMGRLEFIRRERARPVPVRRIITQVTAPSVPPPPPVPLSSGATIATYAREFIGAPYAWAGTGPAFDCSGLALVVYAHFGISLEHSAEWDYQNGRAVSDPVPGDLVVFLSGGYAYHVGIYEGDGTMVSALDYQSGVALTSLSWGGPDYAFVAF